MASRPPLRLICLILQPCPPSPRLAGQSWLVVLKSKRKLRGDCAYQTGWLTSCFLKAFFLCTRSHNLFYFAISFHCFVLRSLILILFKTFCCYTLQHFGRLLFVMITKKHSIGMFTPFFSIVLSDSLQHWLTDIHRYVFLLKNLNHKHHISPAVELTQHNAYFCL